MIALLPTLLAAADQIISLIVGLAVLVIWIIGQIAESRKQQQPQRPDAVRPRERRPRADQADQLRSEVEEFLRQAGDGERRPAPQAQPPQQPRPPRRSSTVEVLIDDDPAALEVQMLEPTRPRDRGAKKKAPSARVQVEPVERAAHEDGIRTLVERTSHLGDRVALADDQMAAHVHAKFDHAVGRLSAASISSAYQLPVAENAPASQIAAMLCSPQGVRQAIVLSEVLNRPEHRWD